MGLTKKINLSGGGRKSPFIEMEKKLVAWIHSQDGVLVTDKCIIDKALELKTEILEFVEYSDPLSEDFNFNMIADIKEFKASKGKKFIFLRFYGFNDFFCRMVEAV